MAADRRARYAQYQPVFWRRSEFVVARRPAYNRHLGEAVTQWAFCRLTESAWARDFYGSKIAVGKTSIRRCAPWATAGSKSCGTAGTKGVVPV